MLKTIRLFLMWMLMVCVFIVNGTTQTIRRIPVAMGLASHPVNGGHCLVSDGTYQYLAFYDGDHQLTVAKRKLGETHWDFAQLPEKVGWDTHNKVVLFLDRQGYLHVTGNMHCKPLRYYRTKQPGDIHSFQGIHTWTGKYENRVTYPSLLVRHDGSIHIMYRHGGSGNGKRLLVHYDEKTQTWSGTGEAFISGMEHEPDCNAYPFGGIQEDSQGTLHIAWCWRETPDVETNYDVCYAQSKDGGFTWTRWNGSPYDLPIRPDNAEVVDDIAQKAGLMNGGSLVIDQNGIPYIGYTRFDDQGYNQMYVATPDGQKWKIIQVSRFNKRFWFEGRGSIPASPPIPRLHLDSSNRLQVRQGGKEIILSRVQLLNMKPGDVSYKTVQEQGLNIPHIRATNRGPLPKGQKHYMQQQTDQPNRDRKPEHPHKPTMIYIVEADG